MNGIRHIASRLTSRGLDLLGRQDVVEWLIILAFLSMALGFCWKVLNIMEGFNAYR